MDTTNADIRPWKTDLMDKIARGNSNRNVFWIQGNDGNEGKCGNRAISKCSTVMPDLSC